MRRVKIEHLGKRIGKLRRRILILGISAIELMTEIEEVTGET